MLIAVVNIKSNITMFSDPTFKATEAKPIFSKGKHGSARYHLIANINRV